MESEFDQVVAGYALREVSLENGMILDFRVRILHEVVHTGHASLQARLYHDVLRDMEDLERVGRRVLDEEVEWLKGIRLFSILKRFSAHASPPIILRNVNPLKICNKNIPVVFDDFAALGKDAFQHVVVIDKSGDGVGEHDAVHFLTQCKFLIENVSADQLELVDHALLRQNLSRFFNHLGRNIESKYLLGSFFSQLLPDGARSATHLQESLSFDAFVLHFFEG